MRVLFVTSLYDPSIGGTEIFLRQLNAELRARGHGTMVITSHGNEAGAGLDHVDGVPVHRLSAHDAVLGHDPAALLRLQAQVGRIAADFQPDLVHAHGVGPTMWICMRSVRRRKDPFIVTLHNVMSCHFGGELSVLGTILSGADAVTGVSEAVTTDALHYAPHIADRLSVIPNGIEPMSSPTPIPERPVRLACIGRLTTQKGFDLAIEAMAQLADDLPEVTLSILGDGEERERLQELVRNLGIGDRVEFEGLVDRDRVRAVLEQSRAVVIPSRYEGLCLVALEAAWAARPVVATDAPGMSEALDDEETGIAVPVEDPLALAAAIRRLVDDRLLAEHLGKQGRARAERAFSMVTCADAYERVYEKVLAQR